jgi:pimeloyl-ACP methyl ester carboxylesterase
VGSTYVVLTDDQVLPPALQRQMAARLGRATVVELDAGHSAMVSRPRALAALLLAYA